MIRPFTPADVERVGAIWLAASLRAHDFVPASFWHADHAVMVGEILPGAEGFVHLGATVADAPDDTPSLGNPAAAENPDAITGFLTGRDGSIGCLFVDPALQGRGIGAALLAHVQARHATLRLTVYEQNPRAVRFYERHGFRATERRACEHTGCPELVMRWDAMSAREPGAPPA